MQRQIMKNNQNQININYSSSTKSQSSSNSRSNIKSIVSIYTTPKRISREQIISNRGNPSFYEYIQSRINNKSMNYIFPFSQRSLTNKHFYNLEKKIENLNEVLSILQEIYDIQTFELKDEIDEVLMFHHNLQSTYQRYEGKLVKLINLQKQTKLKQFLPIIYVQENKQLMVQSKIKTKQQTQNIQNYIETIKKQSQLLINQENQIKPINFDPKIHRILKCQQNSKSHFNKVLQKININQIKKTELIQCILSSKKQIQSLKQTYQQLNSSVCSVKLRKQNYLQQIGSIQHVKLSCKGQNQKLKSSYQKKKLQKQQLNMRLFQVNLTQSLLNYPINNLYLLKKQQNNHLQNLRGNIRVYCRIRPLTLNEAPMIYGLKSHDLLFIKKSFHQRKSENIKNDYQFVFDCIFDQSSSQKQVFSQISQLIQSSIDGVNVCIFAYGQTGSGKTFTMQGNNLNGNQAMGLIPRSTELIFFELQKYKQKDWQTEIEVSINEIYNDVVVNLLNKSKTKSANPCYTSAKSIFEVNQLFARAISNRSTAFTLSNADSSRSHLIFIIRIRSYDLKGIQKQKQSHLVLVDLAGSQRVKQSGVSNQRLKQAQHINSSLSQLRQVIRSLKGNKNKPNFRNSKLTYFLEPYLQKGSKTVMFVNVSPAACDQAQSIHSLEFASVAKEVRLQQEQ